jgi:hypothetical protein
MHATATAESGIRATNRGEATHHLTCEEQHHMQNGSLQAALLLPRLQLVRRAAAKPKHLTTQKRQVVLNGELTFATLLS